MHGLVEFISSKPSRTIIFGCLLSSASFLLGTYYHCKPPVKIKDYFHTQISYQKTELMESSNKIVLMANAKEYRFSILLLKAESEINAVEAADKLSLSSTAEVWLNDEKADRPFIRGIKTEYFYLSPEIGASEDDKDNESVVEISLWFWGGGIASILLGILNHLFGKPRRKI